MSQFFQVDAFPYEDNPRAIGRLGVAFIFTIFPNGNSDEACSIKVIFTPQLLRAVGKQFIGKPFITKQDQPKFLRYAFYLLKQQLEDSSLANKSDIIVDHTKAAQVQRGLPRYCELRMVHKGKSYCIGNPDKSVETSYQLCEVCTLPEPLLFRCDNLRIENVKGVKDSQGRYRLAPSYFCLKEKTLPYDLSDCSSLQCFDLYKFQIESQQSKPPIGFKPPSK